MSNVASSVLAQVKPNLYKMIQSKIEMVVKELIDQEHLNQSDILRVLEDRADQIFSSAMAASSTDANTASVMTPAEFKEMAHPLQDDHHMMHPQTRN